MIDFFKLTIPNKDVLEEYLIKNNLINFTVQHDIYTGEIKEYPKNGREFNLAINITPEQAFLKGSLHVFENESFYNKNHNYNDFYYSDLMDMIPFLCELFLLKGNNVLTNLEMGFNLEIDRDPQEFIERNLLMYDFKSHNKNLKFGGRGNFKQFDKTDYSLKIYDKGKQYGLKKNILRIELKILRRRFLNKIDIFSIEDLLDQNKLLKIFLSLINEFNNLQIVDNWDNKQLDNGVHEKLKLYTNPNYWVNLKHQKSWKVIDRQKKEFELILKENNLTTFKRTLFEKLVDKFWLLLNKGNEHIFIPPKFDEE